MSINCSDATGKSGMQADVKTIADLGGHALTAVTAVSVEGALGQQHLTDLPKDLVVEQVRSLLANSCPQAVKVGLLRDPETIAAMGRLLAGGPPLVCAPSFYSTEGRCLAGADAAEAFCQHIVPHAQLLVARCSDVESMLGLPMGSDEEMLVAATRFRAMGARWVMLRGGLQAQGRCTALLYDGETCRFFSTYNVDAWQQHGVGGTLSAAVAARLAAGDTVPQAVSHAHDYLHGQVISSVGFDSRHFRPAEQYNQFLSLIAQHYRTHHEVAFYAQKLSLTPRYLQRLTMETVGKAPKQIVDNYVMHQATALLDTTTHTVQEVAAMLGFANQSAFCTFFKTHQGCTPTQYRGGGK